MVPKLKKSWCRTERRFSIANLNEKAGLIEIGSWNFHLQGSNWTSPIFLSSSTSSTLSLDEDDVSNSTGPTHEILPHHPRPVPTCQRPVRSDACLSRRVSSERMFAIFLKKWRKILEYQNFKVLQRFGKSKKNWLYPKKVETTRRLKVCFLPPFCNQRYRCCTACWRSSRFLCSAWNTCRPALQLNGTADFKYLRRYNQLTLPLCILRPHKTSILHLQPFIPPKKRNKKACAPIHLFTKQDASITLYSFSAASLKKLARISPPSASSNSTWKTFGIQHVIQSSIGQKRLDSKAKLK